MYYIAYGSNINRERMIARCPNAQFVGRGTVHGWKLSFNLHVDLIPGDGADFAPVVVWELPDKDLFRLDGYEGYPKSYVRQAVEAVLDSGKVISGIVYVMAPVRRGGHVPPQESYLRVIVEGCRENDLDMGKLCEALAEAHRAEFLVRICREFHEGQSFEDYRNDICHFLMLTRDYRTRKAARNAVKNAGQLVRKGYEEKLPAASIAQKI